jgi:Lhr-like helicase
MSEIKENIEHKNPLDELIEEINSSIFSKESWIDNEFYKIPEMTYSYEKI